jgi:hypothetical protein
MPGCAAVCPGGRLAADARAWLIERGRRGCEGLAD